nr:hypothetical protein [Streptomyces chrestomyceticus]
MHDAVQAAEPAEHLAQYVPGPRGVGDVGAAGEEFAGQPGQFGLGGADRGRVASEQDDPGVVPAQQVSREQPPDAARTAGDQVPPALPQGRRTGGGRRSQGLEAAHPAPSGPQAHRAGGSGPGEFPQEGAGLRPVGMTGCRPIGVHHPHGHGLSQFGAQRARRAHRERRPGVKVLAAGDLQGAPGDQAQFDGAGRGRERAGQPGKVAQRRAGRVRRRAVPGADDAQRQVRVPLGRLDELGVLVSGARVERDGPAAVPVVAVPWGAGVRHDGGQRRAAVGQFAIQGVGGRAAVVEQHPPVSGDVRTGAGGCRFRFQVALPGDSVPRAGSGRPVRRGGRWWTVAGGREGVRRGGHPGAGRRPQRGRFEVGPRFPGAGERREQHFAVVAFLQRVPHDGHAPVQALGAGQGGQRGAGPHFEQDAGVVVAQAGQAQVEADGVPQVVDPVLGVGEVRVGGAGEVGDQRHAGRRQGDAPHHVAEGAEHRLDEGGVRGGGQRQDVAGDAVRGQAAAGRLDAGCGPGQDACVGPVDHRQADAVAERGLEAESAGADHQHGAVVDAGEQFSPAADEGERVRQGQDTREVGGGVLAETVARQYGRCHSEGDEQPGEGDFGDEDGGHRDARVRVGVRCGVLAGAGRPPRAQAPGRLPVGQQTQACVHGLPEDGFVAVEFTAHARVLRAAAREDEGHLARAPFAGPRRRVRTEGGFGEGVGAVAQDHGAAACEAASADGQRTGVVGEFVVAQAAQRTGVPGGHLVESPFVARRPGQQLPRPGRCGRRGRWRFLEDDVRVRAADPEGADGGAARDGGERPVLARLGGYERAAREVDVGVRAERPVR